MNDVENLRARITGAFLKARRPVRDEAPSEGQILLSFLFVSCLIALGIYLFMPHN